MHIHPLANLAKDNPGSYWDVDIDNGMFKRCFFMPGCGRTIVPQCLPIVTLDGMYQCTRLVLVCQIYSQLLHALTVSMSLEEYTEQQRAGAIRYYYRCQPQIGGICRGICCRRKQTELDIFPWRAQEEPSHRGLVQNPFSI